MNGIVTDVHYALRTFRRAPGFYSLVVAILGLGIATSVAIFSLVDGVLLRPLPYRDPQRLVMLTSYAPRPPFASNGSLSYNDFLQFRSSARSFAGVACTFRTGWSRVTLTSGSEPVTIQGAFASPNLFSLFKRQPILGRTFTSEENQQASRVVVISEGLWAQQFDSSPQAIGQDLLLGHNRWRVIGVMPSDFQVPFLDTKLWAPVRSHPEWNDKEETNPLERARWDIIARLKPGVSLAAAQDEVNSMENGLRAALPEFHGDSVRVVPLREHFAGRMRKPLLILLGAVAFLFLIACANVANLLLARASHRKREIAIRLALGASQGRVVRQLVTEALAFSSTGGAIGVAVALALVPLLKALSPVNIPFLSSVSLDHRALLFALLLSVAVGILLGVVPGYESSPDMNESLKSAGRNSTEGFRSRRFRNVLVAVEFAVAMVLLTGAGLLIRSFVAVLSVDPGFRTGKLVTVQMGLPNGTPAPQLTQFYSEALERIRALPGVTAAGGISNLFFLNETRTHALREVEGHPPEAVSSWTPLVWAQVAGDYFQTMGIPLLRGRFFDERDRPNSPPVAVINETLAQRYWPHENPVGKHLKGFDPRGANDDWLTVVGVVADTRSGGLEHAPMSQIYELQAQRGVEPLGNLVIRTAQSAALAPAIRAVLHNINPNTTISSVATMEQLLGRQETQRRFQTWLIGVFSSLALALALLGVFAVMHYSVAARRSEIGVRMALGARPGDIVRLVLSAGTRVALCGILVGLVMALWLTQLISGMLFNVSANDPITLAASAASLLGVALVGSYAPARAASRIDPIGALREE